MAYASFGSLRPKMGRLFSPPCGHSPTVRLVEFVSLGYRTDLALLKAGGSEIEDRGDHYVVRSPHNPTHWWGNFLLLAETPPPEGAGVWLDRFAAAFPNAAHVALGFDTTSAGPGEIVWFSDRGFKAESMSVMTATDLVEPTHKGEAECRQLGSEEDWKQSVELGMACSGPHFEERSHRLYLEAKMRTQRQLVEGGLGAWFGAFVNGRLASQMGLFSAGDGLARFQSVETHPELRRRGLARSLLLHAGHYGLDEMGARTLVIVADPEYFAIDLYRTVGFVVTEVQLQVERSPASSLGPRLE